MRHKLDVRTLQVQRNPSIASDAAPGAHRPADGRLRRHCSAYKIWVRVGVSIKILHQMICYIYNSLEQVSALMQAVFNDISDLARDT